MNRGAIWSSLAVLLSSWSSAWALDGLYDGKWLAEAEARIEEHRKADLRVLVTESNRPAEGAEVRIEMIRHAFPFGSAVSAHRLVSDTSPDGERYRRTVARLFNRVVLENDLKWPAWDGEWGDHFNRDQTMKALAWLRERNIGVRGHCLVWPGWRHLPKALKRLEHDPDGLEKRARQHVLEEASMLRGWVDEWDVVNETYWNRDLQDALGRGALVDWFRWAREADPDVKLFINDARIVGFGALETAHQDYYFNDIKYLVEEGAPIGGIGLQCHFREEGLTHPERALAVLDRFAGFKLDLAITEFDVHTEEEDLQAKYLRDFMHVAFSHPAVTEFIMWGFWEGQIYKEPRALYRRDWSAKPAGLVFEELVFDTWWTRDEGATSAHGVYATRGFLGEYRVSVSRGGRTHTVTCSLDGDGTAVEMDLSSDHHAEEVHR